MSGGVSEAVRLRFVFWPGGSRAKQFNQAANRHADGAMMSYKYSVFLWVWDEEFRRPLLETRPSLPEGCADKQRNGPSERIQKPDKCFIPEIHHVLSEADV